MRSRTMVEKTIHFLVHNSFLFTVATMCVVHAVLLGVSGYANVPPLTYFNILSVTIYLFCILLCKLGAIMPVYISILLEVAVYSVLSVYFIGWDSGSYGFLISIVPIIIYFGCFLIKGPKRWFIAFILACDFALFTFLYLRFADAKPVYETSYGVKVFLVVFISFVVIFAIAFYNVIYIYSNEFELSSLEKKNVKLSADAQEDALTGLLNRRGFLPHVKKCMENEMTSHFCIAFFDIDNFKRVNDSYGHDGGDEVLRHISNIVVKEMHGCDICRWGGEEIVILMKDYDFAVAKQKMEYLRKHIEATPTIFYNKRIQVTVTIGLEENNETYKEPEEIITVADSRMYYGKQHGKNIVIFEDLKD